MADERDPRLDPMAGDITANTNGSQFYVRRVDTNTVWYQEDGIGDLVEYDITDWRECAVNDTIIQRGSP